MKHNSNHMFHIVGIFLHFRRWHILMHKRSELITTVTVLLWLSWYHQIVGIFLRFVSFMKPWLFSQGTAIPLFWRTYFNSVLTLIFQIVEIFLHFERMHIFNEWEIWPNNNNHCVAVTLLISSNRRNIPTIWTIHEAPTTLKWSVIPTFRTYLNLNSILTQIFQIVWIFLHFQRSHSFNEWEIWPNHNNHLIAVTLLISSNGKNNSYNLNHSWSTDYIQNDQLFLHLKLIWIQF